MPVRLTIPQREALRDHYLVRRSIRTDKTCDWRCFCGVGGHEPDSREAHRMFAHHLDTIKLTVKD